MLKSKYRWPFAAALNALLLVIAQAAPALTATSALRTTLQELRANYVQGLLSGKVDLWSAAWAENIRMMTEAQPTVVGQTNAASYYRAFLIRFSVRACTRTETGIFDLGSRVVEIGRFTQKLTQKSTGEMFDLNGKYLDAWEKLPDGKLQLVTSAWNYDSWLPKGEAMRFGEVPSVRTAFQARAPITSNVSFELAALCRLLETAITQHDGSLWARFYADDSVLLANNGGLHAGRKAVDEYLATHCPQMPVFEKLDIRNDRIEELGDYVFEYASHVANWRNGDSSGVSTGKNLRIWRREPDHALKIVFQIGAYD